ncbi:MAG: hypothetical protein ACREJX_04860, partial [Polyangiaceae bacterium]
MKVVYAVAPLGTLFFFLDSSTIPPNDVWWHLRAGDLLRATHHLTTTDSFSFTRSGAYWPNQAWLMQLQVSFAHAIGGDALVLFVNTLFIAAGYALVFVPLIRRHGARAAAAAMFAGMMIAAENWAVRPQAFSFFAFGALVSSIERHREGHARALYFAPVLFLVWANAHAGFVFGLLLLAIYFGGTSIEAKRMDRTLLAILVACVVASVITPLGPSGTIRYFSEFVGSHASATLNAEYRGVSITEPDGQALALWCLVLLGAWISARPGLPLDRILTFAAFFCLELWALRNAVWLGLAVMPIAAEIFDAAEKKRGLDRAGADSRLDRAIAVFFGIAAIASLPWFRPMLPMPASRRDLLSTSTPVAAMKFACANLPDGARVFQEDRFGVYQIWACPRLPVFIDTRFELYPVSQMEDYLAISEGRPESDALLEKYGVTHLFLSTETQAGAITRARTSPAWR